ncbi:unnamed protein product [Heterobilharzia americana]|nr:unnamed protein product [Heterobilharzia americana]
MCSHIDVCQFAGDRDRLIRGTLLEALLHKFDFTDDITQNPLQLNVADHLPVSLHCALHSHVGKESNLASTVSRNNSRRNWPLPNGCILQRILSVQLLNATDIGFIIPHYERVCSFLTSHGWTWDMWLKLEREGEASKYLETREIAESFDVVEKYLISLVARDCSIMITVQRARPDCPSTFPVISGGCSCVPKMLISCVIIDLDPKPLIKLSDRLAVETSVAIEAFNLQHKILSPEGLS